MVALFVSTGFGFFNVFVLLLKNSSGNNIVDVINDVISISFSF